MSELPSPETLLERVHPFQFLSKARRKALAERLELRRYPDGALLVRADELSHAVFLLAQGEVECIDDREPGPAEQIASMKRSRRSGSGIRV